MIDKKKIGLGTVQFGLNYGISNKSGRTSPHEVKNILNLASQEKIDVLDCASAYGSAEEVLGRNNLEGFKVVSKFISPGKGEKVLVQLRQSLQNLKSSTLYAYLAHRPQDLLDHPEQWEELKQFKEEGTVAKIGFSLNEPSELHRLLNKGFEPDLIQVPYNYLDRRFEHELIGLKAKGCEVHTRSAFLQGLFFVNPDDLDVFFDQVKPVISELQKNGKVLPGQLLKFVIEKPFVDRVVMGIETEKQLYENLNLLEIASSLPEMNQMISEKILIPSKWPQK